jgi:hypothetical protein
VKKTLFLALLCLFAPLRAAPPPYAQALKDRARERGLARDAGWLRLLHVRKGYFLSRAEPDGRGFYLSRRGKKDSQAEMDATLEGFFEGPPADPEGQSPQCRFPARYAWLKEKLAFDPALLPEQPCARLDAWMSRMDPGGLTLIYASAYMNNPASMYGHTFLRVEPAGPRAATPLLAYSVNFAAETTETNGITFAVKGLLGGYPGKYSTLPYYMKVQQYTNMESRDLWEYRLNVSPETARRLLLHLWEMGSTWFDYYFLTKNCSYQLLPLLEAADPSLDLSRQFHYKVIPVDSLRAVLSSPGLVKERVVRPSVVRTLMARRALLTRDEAAAAKRLAFHPDDEALLARFPAARRGLLLDSAYDYLRLKHHFDRFPTPAQDKEEHDLLVRRQKEPAAATDPETAAGAEASAPESGHRTGSLSLSPGRRRARGFTELSLRGAMHDLEEDPTGYIPGSRLEMFHLRLRYFDVPHRLTVHKATAVDVMSLFPLDRWVRYPSWKFFMGADTPLDRAVRPGDGLLARLNGGSGVTLGADGGKTLGYALAGLDTGFGGALRKDYRIGWTGELGLLQRWGRRARLHGEAFHRRYFLGEAKAVDGVRGVLSLSAGERWEARLSAEREGRGREAAASLRFYL